MQEVLKSPETEAITQAAEGGLASACLLSFTDVLHALVSSCCCPPGCVVVCWYPLALPSGPEEINV